MTTLSILTLAMLGASQVWTESSLVDVYPDSGPTLAAGEDIRLYAARGEWESFQLCVQAGRNGMSGVAIQSESPHATIPEPEIRRVGYLSTASPSARAYRNESMHPDPLIPFDGANLEPDETLALWVTYYIPPETPSGIHRGKLTVSQDRGRSFPVEVTIEVFDMTLSELPALRSLAPLDRDMMRAFYGIDSDAVEAWAPYYEAFAGSRLSLSLWHGYGLVHLDGEGNANAARFKEHLSFAIDRLAMNTINVANGAFGLDPFPPPAADGSDPLQRYLEDMGDWLTEQDWINRAVILPLSMPPREYWPAARGLYDRIKTADSRFKRLLAGAPHPFFEQYAEVWAVPLRHYHPQSLGRLQEGMSLSTPLPYTARSIQASSSGYLDDIDMYATEAEDAYDGSLFTAWCSASPPTSERPQWFELRFDDPIETDQISIDWEPGFEAEAMRLSIAPYGTRMTSASARWEHRLARGPHERSRSTGQLRTSWRFEAIRIEFLRSRRGGPVAIRQLEFGREPDPSSIAAIPPVETWLCPLDGDFPGLAVDAHPVELRLLPWVCWGHGKNGFTLPGLTRWPARWRAHVDTPPLVWSGGETGEDFLYYPGPNGPMPSIRSMRLRDGLEDYEYLRKTQLLIDQDKAPPEASRWVSRWEFPYDLAPDDLDDLAERITDRRLRIGREHTGPPLLPWQRRSAP